MFATEASPWNNLQSLAQSGEPTVVATTAGDAHAAPTGTRLLVRYPALHPEKLEVTKAHLLCLGIKEAGVVPQQIRGAVLDVSPRLLLEPLDVSVAVQIRNDEVVEERQQPRPRAQSKRDAQRGREAERSAIQLVVLRRDALGCLEDAGRYLRKTAADDELEVERIRYVRQVVRGENPLKTTDQANSAARFGAHSKVWIAVQELILTEG